MNSVYTLEELFRGKVLVVPDYQRGYAWEERQWDDFLEDLEYLTDARHHYTGTVVLHQQLETVRDEEGQSHKAFHVVDGQQRLATVVLLLECIRARVADFDPTLAAGIKKAYIEFRDLNHQPAHKLQLNSDCHQYFVRNVLTEPTGPQGPLIASHKRLREAKTHFTRYLDRKAAEPGTSFSKWLIRFYEKVVLQLKVSQYIVEQSSEVGVIFEVMNNRGKPLSELEKVKNYLLYLASKLELDEQHDLADRINATWTEVFTRLMAYGLNSNADEDRLLRAHWLMVYDPNAREWEGSVSIKARYNLKRFQGKHAKLLGGLARYTSTLKDALVGFCEAYRPSHSDAFNVFQEFGRSEVRKAGEKLRRIGLVAPFLPLLIACRVSFPTDHSKYLELLRLCEIFAFRVYRVMQRRADAGQAILFRLGYELHHGKTPLDAVLMRIRMLALPYCSNEDLAADCALDDLENDWYSWPTLRYVLYEYEAHLAGKHGVKVSWDQFEKGDVERTIEHILPQNADSPYWRERFDRQQRRRLTHDIGNLCLTEDNSVYGNRSFPEKKGQPGQGRCYANSNLFQERELAQHDDWTEESILQRRQKIIDWYLKRWHLDFLGLPKEPIEVEGVRPDEGAD